jgi:hypothetical protein
MALKLENLGGYHILLFDGLLATGIYPEGPATGHLDTGFLGFPLSLSKC